MRVAFLSGGKDSYYAVYRAGIGVDVGLVLVYEFPRPSPHTLNLGKTVETILLMGIPTVVVKLRKGKEFEETVEVLKRMGVDTIIAGDVYIEEHLNYMEKLAKEVGAKLLEPLWGSDPVDLLYKELGSGIKPFVIGCRESISHWLGRYLDVKTVDEFIENLKRMGMDPLGEHGEYHTIVVNGPLHASPLTFKVLGIEDYNNYKILRIL